MQRFNAAGLPHLRHPAADQVRSSADCADFGTETRANAGTGRRPGAAQLQGLPTDAGLTVRTSASSRVGQWINAYPHDASAAISNSTSPGESPLPTRSRGRSTPPTRASTRSSRSGVVVPRTREDVDRARSRSPRATASRSRRGAAASRRRPARRSAAGLQLDTSEVHSIAVLEVNVAERWARVEPGVVLDELNAQLPAARSALRARHLHRQPRRPSAA